ncbi:MAG: imidazolonepropionase [Bdellovibrio sp. CG10_big_fil_rev_8_21_14_0_10_47_8]|nr:MAG: imidazolonepropionase [Bdellovibrio sp. CG10_big_fil_rev_8_21_14_0_10_47_8]
MATIYRNIGELLTLQGAAEKKGRKTREADLGILPKAAMVVHRGVIVWLGPEKKLKTFKTKEFKSAKEIDMNGMTVLPGFVECHTHSLFAGSRAHEFELRQQGATYQEISKAGGGVLSTVQATRKASEVRLRKDLEQRIERFSAQGVTTVEVKSGYALNKTGEIKSLKVIRSLDQKPIQVVPTFLGAHSIPTEFSSAREYLASIESYLPEVKKWTDRLDIWIEKGFFETSFSRAYLQKAKELGFQIVIHADQLTLSGGTALATQVAAVSADHVIQISDIEIDQVAKSDMTAVLLPMADLYMKCAYPPARKLIDAGARVALATDFNPGTCPSQDLSLVGLLARLEMKMSLPEVIAAYTVGAASALKLEAQVGSLELGKDANFFGTAKDWNQLFYSAGDSSVDKIVFKGRNI